MQWNHIPLTDGHRWSLILIIIDYYLHESLWVCDSLTKLSPSHLTLTVRSILLLSLIMCFKFYLWIYHNPSPGPSLCRGHGRYESFSLFFFFFYFFPGPTPWLQTYITSLLSCIRKFCMHWHTDLFMWGDPLLSLFLPNFEPGCQTLLQMSEICLLSSIIIATPTCLPWIIWFIPVCQQFVKQIFFGSSEISITAYT